MNSYQEYVCEGFCVDFAVMRADLYRLLSYTLASEKTAEICAAEGEDCPFRSLVSEFEQSEILRLLVSTAVQVRIIYENLPASVDTTPLDAPVGTVIDNLQGDRASTVLNVRKATSKIIHAKKWSFEISTCPTNDLGCIGRSIQLENAVQNPAWQANICLTDFIEHCYRIVDAYDDLD